MPFHVTPEKTVRVPIMNQKATFPYYRNNGIQALELPYVGKDISMLILLPNRDMGIKGLQAQMTEKNFRTLYKPFGPSIGQTSIPEDLINKINNYIDELIKDKERAKKQSVGKILAGNVTQEFYLGKLAGNGHPAWDSPVKFNEAALYMTTGATESGDSLGTMFSMKVFPGMIKTDKCVIKITWELQFGL